MRAKLEKALGKAARFLGKRNIPYAIIGGLALSQWGFDRFTDDIDFKIFVQDSDFPAMRAILREAFPINARPDLPQNSPVVAVKIDDVTVDFGLGFPGFDSLVIERAVEFPIKKLKLRFATAEDLILLKLIAERSKDWIDIEGLTNARYHDLDFAYIQNWLEQFAEILEEPDLVSKYNQIVTKAKQLNDQKIS